MMFADDVVLRSREKDVCLLELELEQWREALKKRGMKVPRAKAVHDNIIVPEWNAIRNVNMQSVQLPQVTEFQYMGSTQQRDGDMSHRSKQEDTVWMEQLEEDARRPMRYESTTTCRKYPQDGRSVSYAVRDGDRASH